MKRQKRIKKYTAPQKTVVVLPPPPPRKRRQWLFRFVSLILVPLLFFSILEGGLRCFGYGYSPRAIIKHTLEDKDVYCHNYRFGWRFFPRSIARHFEGFVFDTQKSPDTYRIFILGESAALGVPAPAYNVGRMLEVMLDELYPEIRFEVHTVAMPAINSHVVLEIAKDCARHQPDLFIVYCGNNEIVGPYGPGTVFAPLSPSLSLIRASIAMRSTRTGQLLEQGLQWAATRRQTPLHWGGMEMFLEKQVRYDDPALDITYRHFEQNLRDICRTGLKAGAAVIVSNVCTNLKDSPPFASLHRTGLTEAEKQTWQALYQEGVALEAGGQAEQAIEKYREAEKIDATYADLQFRLGKCCQAIGDFQNAGDCFTRAREYDTLRFRADTRINDIIRTVANTEQRTNLYFVDAVEAMETASPNRLPGGELFYEHVHKNFTGNYIAAATLLPQIQQILPVSRPSAESAPFSEADVARLLAYTEYDRAIYWNIIYQTFLTQPPFTNQLYHTQTLEEVQQGIDAILADVHNIGLNSCLRLYRQAIANRPDDWHLLTRYCAFVSVTMKDNTEIEAMLRKVIKRCPYQPAYLQLASVLSQQSRIPEAQAILYELLELNPNVVFAHIELASIFRLRRDYTKEIQHLLTALSLEPRGLFDPYMDLAVAYDNVGDPDNAIQTLYTVVKLFPEEQTAPARAFLAILLFNRQDYRNAKKEIQTAVQINPDVRKNPAYEALLIQLESMQIQ